MEDFIRESSADFDFFGESIKSAEAFAGDRNIIKKLSKEKIKEQIDKFSEKAKQLMEHPEKVSAVLEKATALCESLSELRIIGKHFKEASLVCSMLNDYICKRYTQIPTATVITLLAAVLYFVSPIDIIPDFLPLVGHLDDMIIFGFVQDAARADLKKYEKWKKENEGPDLISEK